MLVVQSEPYNASRLATVLGRRNHVQHRTGRDAGNVFLPSAATGLPQDSVVNVTALVTLNTSDLTDWAGQVSANLMHHVDRGLRRVLGL